MSETFYDLHKDRTVVLTDRGRTFIFDTRPITDALWRKYFSAIYVSSEMQKGGKDRTNVMDFTTPRLALADEAMISARGYTVTDARPLNQLHNWQQRIPVAHRIALGEALADVRVSMQDESQLFVIHAEGECVSIDALGSAVNAIEGDTLTMERICGLKHYFKTPSEEQHQRYAREGSRSFIVGGSRTSRTVYPGAHLLLAKLYDELIVSVDGYCVGDQLLQDNRELIVDKMDMLHKVIAAQELFNPQSDVKVAGGGE